MAPAEHVSCGLAYHDVPDIYNSLKAATESGFNFIVAPISHPRHRREFFVNKVHKKHKDFARADLCLSSEGAACDWSRSIVGKIASWIDPDSPVLSVRKNSESALDQELDYAAHLGLPAVLVTPRSKNCVNLARCINSKIMGLNGRQPAYNVWVSIPMKSYADEPKRFFTDKPEGAEGDKESEFTAPETLQDDTWEWWNTFRTICNTDKKVVLSLVMSADLPNYCEVQRWLGEPIKSVFISTSLFQTNKKGYPVLPLAHQNLFKKLCKLKVQAVVYGTVRHSHIGLYQQYLDHLWRNQEPDNALARYAYGYEDYLQYPLQPLCDNLESATYETFERDPTKYTEYRNAIHLALVDRVPEEEKETKTTVVMVVGAGRGPLVEATLQASKSSSRLVKVYAVEKNPNAYITLLNRQYESWGENQVTVVNCDMRDFDPPEQADILVSELLGSFGDNELSPECLDGAQRFLKSDGISIPCSYTSYLCPVSAPKLFSEIIPMSERYKHHLTFVEMPWVVRLHNYTSLANTQPVFTFVHPNRAEVVDNSRYVKLTFTVPFSDVIHGFAGYFETVLYKDIILSIHPKTHSPGLFSWFPIFFPLKDPVYIGAKEELEVHFWRCISPKSVWYEWMVAKPTIGSIHNPNGRSCKIKL